MVSAALKNTQTPSAVPPRSFGWMWMVLSLGVVLAPVLPDFDVKTAILQIGFALLMALYSFRLWDSRYRGGKPEALLSLFVVYALLSAVWSPIPMASFHHFLFFLPCWGVFILLRQSPGEPTSGNVVSALAVGFGLASLLGLSQLFPIRWIPSTVLGDKVYSTFGSSESWAFSLMAVAPLLLLSETKGVFGTSLKIRSFLGVLLLLNLLFSGTVSAGICIAVTGFLIWALRSRSDGTGDKKNDWRFYLGIAMILIGVSLGFWNASPLGDRWSVLKNASRMSWDSPILGWGGGGYSYRGFDYLTVDLNRRLSLQPDFAKDIHNEYLESTVEYGLLGLGLWLVFGFDYFKRLLSGLKKNPMTAGLGFSCIVGLWVSSAFSDALRQPASLFFLMVAMAWWLNRVSPAEERTVARNVARPIALVLLCLSAMLLWGTTRDLYLDHVAYPSDRFVERLPRDIPKRISILEGLRSRHSGLPVEVPILYQLGKTYRDAGRLDDAQSVLQFARRKDPRSVEVCVLLGEVFYQNSHGDDDLVYAAIRSYSQALEVQPDSVEILLARAKLDWTSKRISDCSADLQHILRVQPDHPEAKRMIRVLMR